MSSKRDPRRELDDDDAHSDDETSFAGVIDLGSMPPPASGQVDVHRAATAVSTMTDELMDEIRRARDEARLVESQKTRIQQKFAVPDDAIPGFTDETPTRPGKEKSVTAPPPGDTREPAFAEAFPAAPIEQPAPAPAAALAPAQVTTPTAPSAFAVPTPVLARPPVRMRRALLPRLIFLVVTLAALVVTALAARRYRTRLRR